MTKRMMLVRTLSAIVSAMTTAIGLQAAPGAERCTGLDDHPPAEKL